MIHLGCGHATEDFEDSQLIAIKAWEITEHGWVKAIHYLSVCPQCVQDYKADNAILENEYEEAEWINHKT